MFVFFFFFFKQKTAYEMRISDWSSDVCSSDLVREDVDLHGHVMEHLSPELLSLVPLDHQQRYLRVHLQNAQHLLTQRSTEKLHCHCIFHLAAPTRITRLDRKSTRLNSSH